MKTHERSKEAPKRNRLAMGHSVFNYVDMVFGVARAVQYNDGIDCFYNDNAVDAFIDAATVRIYKSYDHESK